MRRRLDLLMSNSLRAGDNTKKPSVKRASLVQIEPG